MFDGKPLIKKELAYCSLNSTWGPNGTNMGGFIVSYGAEGFGFGNLTFVIREDGSLTCDNEREDRDTVKYIMNCLVDRATFKDSKDGKDSEIEAPKTEDYHGNNNKKDAE